MWTDFAARSAQVTTPASGTVADPVLLVDPEDRLIMTYPADASPQGMRADLERLLKYAWTG